MTTTNVLVQTAFTLLFAAILVGWFARPATDPKEVTAWAKGHNLVLTERNQAMVTYYVRLAITLRVIGGVGGLVLGALFDDAFGLDTSTGAGFWIWVVMGWLAGAGWAEYRLTRPSTAGQVASLTPRRVHDYLSPRLHAAPAGAAVIVTVFAVGGLLASDGDPTQGQPPSDIGLGLAVVGSALVAGMVMVAVRAVVARRQPTGPTDVVAADDAIRASAVHHLAGGGTAALLLIATQVAWSVLAPHQLPIGMRGWVPALLLVAAVVAWRWYAYRGWRVRRGDPTAVMQA